MNAPTIYLQNALPAHRGLYYGGEWHDAANAAEEEIFSPSTGTSLGKVAWAGSADVDAAVQQARLGFQAWRKISPLARASCLRQAAALVRQHGDELAAIDAADCGNPFRALKLDVGMAAHGLEYFAGLIAELKGQTLPMEDESLNYTVREPLGVVCRINAYNHPFMFAARGAAAVLAAGNSLIIKSPEQAPLSTLRLAELLGPLFPPGVFNVLSGGRECGEALTTHPGIAKIALIGSVPTGKAIARAAADTLKRVTLELGGKNALIAYPDADIDKVAEGAVAGMNFAWAGQSCGSTSRLFLHSSIHDAVVERIVEAARRIQPGIPTHPDTQMGCLVSQAQFDRVVSYINSGVEQGARLLTGGKRPQNPELAQGYFIEPTVFSEVTPDMQIARQEIFGPVMAIMRWQNEDAMFEAVNELDVGLTASIWTSDLIQAHRAAGRIEAGYIWINRSSKHFPGAPFGGYKQSGIGRDESLDELLDNTQIKNVNVNLEP
ncbi:aldehyde dehydrogenase family protein [Pusillimonas sp. CC-YST705]|uniref:Aldehyde dehydrogenase family protein n=1 Tax=Mesopusillimonas faecipullorum TaxID=2755040 RepID=A0ABS8CBI4_9BURK|nr:aldehyde dehydrogenase family protein [Mesopusillimonas faecipullorum]MCB5363401.1 aldehyde dehydrogenase family protein [Mesopusillimonas faecipullorum]